MHVARDRRTRGWLSSVWLAIVVGLIAAGCGSSGAAGTQTGTRPGGESCLDAASSGSLCDTLVDHFARCAAGGVSREHLIEDCRATWGDYSDRANGCFLSELSGCMGGPCEGVDAERCFREATVASDPDSFDARTGAACASDGDCDGRDDGWMGRCVDKLEGCSKTGDLCATAVSLKRPFRGQVDGCLEEGCATLEDCIYAAMGHH